MYNINKIIHCKCSLFNDKIEEKECERWDIPKSLIWLSINNKYIKKIRLNTKIVRFGINLRLSHKYLIPVSVILFSESDNFFKLVIKWNDCDKYNNPSSSALLSIIILLF